MKRFLFITIFNTITFIVHGQCGSNVPNYIIDLSGAPDSTWVLNESDALDREGQCCGVPSSQNCISFTITLDPNSAGIFFDYDGAPGYGSLNWSIDCGPQYNLKDTICITDIGPFTLTFCKPGSDNGNYTLISVPKPTFPGDQIVPANCVQPVEVLGVTAASIQWNSITPGASGAYNYLLDCTNCLSPTFSPDPSAPTYFEYQVCGYPILDYCVGAFTYCDTVSFTVLDSLKVFAPNESFCSGGTATVNASAVGGDGNYLYYWYDNSMTQIATGPTFMTSIAGTYTVEVRDGNYEPGACDDFFHTFTVSEVLPPAVNAGIDVVLCATSPAANLVGTLTNASTGIWSGGVGTYVSSNTDLTLNYIPTLSEIEFGSVTLTLTSTDAGAGCAEDNDQVSIFFVDTIETDLVDFGLDCNNSEITISPNVSGGLLPLTYQWTTGSTTLSTVVGEGTHCLTITDANGCLSTDCFTVTVPSSLTLAVSSTPVTVDGGSDGTANVIPTGGTAPYTYLWNTGGTTSSLAGLVYGLYTVTVTDDNGCQMSGSTVVNNPFCGGFFVNTNSTPVLCFADSTGTATVSIMNGTSPFDILWNDYGSQTSTTALNLPAGTYSVIVTDDNGCLAYGVVPVTEPDAISNSFTHTNVTTQGGTDGTIQTNVSGGIGTYDYLWSTTSTGANLSGIPYGWYSVQITDNNACVFTDSIYISQPPCNLFNIYVGATSVSCNGGSDGTATLDISNGTGPYDILWSTTQTATTTITNLAADVYTVEVTDAQNCYAFASFGIAEPSPLTLGFLTAPSTCYGADNGTINLTVSGGTFPFYEFLWENNSTNEDRINLATGAYSVTITDQNNCIASGSTIILEPDSIQVSYTSTQVTCFEGNDGAIDITVTGGSPVFNYDWSNGSITQDLSGIDVGGYILTLTDGNFCTMPSPLTILISQPAKVEADTIIVDCPIPGFNVTTVNTTPIGGTSNYAISVDGGIAYGTVGDYSLSIPVDSIYTFVIQDQNGCLSDPYVVSIDTNVIAQSIDFNVCYIAGQTTETVSVIPGGGFADYSISTDNGVSFNPVLTYDLILDIDDTYSFIVQDSKGCFSETYSVLLPAILSLSLDVSTDYNGFDISCFGLADGGLVSTANGGSTPYTYSWDSGASSPTLSGLSSGTYTLTLTDAAGCQIISGITLVDPPLLTAPIGVTSNYNGEDISCNDFNDGEATVTPTGGTGTYTYNWSDSQTTATAIGLSAGSYSVTVYDLNLCSATANILLSQPDTLNIAAVITDVSCNGGNDGAIDITSTGGVTPYSFDWSNGPTTEDVTTLSAGTYAVTLTDANDCIYVLSNLVVDPTLIDLDLTTTDALCNDDSTGTADLTIAGGTPPYQVLWSNGQTTEDLVNLPDGNYIVTVTDDNGCWTDISGIVNEPDTLNLSSIITPVLCYGNNDGSIAVIASGGVGSYSFDWSNSDIDTLAENLSAGNYSVVVTDLNNCIYTANYTVSQPDSLWATYQAAVYFHDHNITYHDGTDGSIDIEAFGGTSPYTYLWSNQNTTQDLNGLNAGYYSVTITDDNGCIYVIGDTLSEPLDLELPTAISPNGDSQNEYFVVHGLEAYPENYFVVTNRWGNVVFEQTNYTNNWNGLNQNGKELPDGVYFIILEIKDGEQFTGYVEVKRN